MFVSESHFVYVCEECNNTITGTLRIFAQLNKTSSEITGQMRDIYIYCFSQLLDRFQRNLTQCIVSSNKSILRIKLKIVQVNRSLLNFPKPLNIKQNKIHISLSALSFFSPIGLFAIVQGSSD